MDTNKISLILEAIGSPEVDPDLVVRLQAVIFASEYPVTIKKLKEFFEDYELDQIEQALVALFSLHEEMGIQLNRVGGGYLFTTAAACGGTVRQFM
ncbi:SMC-Scp complex subunit ScpB, partial [Myxococcota bacterium]|nr:SMC-Scp complex subunit ScpB [Myxococcota bacterium]MBU1535739.1 SMC-Scp complex subunit ScpB [Myxococcota bacterium]